MPVDGVAPGRRARPVVPPAYHSRVHAGKSVDTVGFTDQQAPEAAWRSAMARSTADGTARLPGQSGRQA